MHFLVTGHTGFKGAWLVLMLRSLGHSVSGMALDPEQGSLFLQAKVDQDLEYDERADIRDPKNVLRTLEKTTPDVVIHMAAQPLVRASYVNPRETIETNVMGTLAVLEAVALTPSVKAQVIVTTDKVYRNIDSKVGYTESDPLGGDDPYSASKAMADILTTSWVHSFSGPPTAIARAGNVIGGGDIAPDRLLPDIITALAAQQTVQLRYPNAVRPWQHVLDCLNGYVALVDAVMLQQASGAWNFGPDANSNRTVAQVAELATTLWGSEGKWVSPTDHHPHEANVLTLNAAKAQTELGWVPKLGFEDSVAWTVNWYRDVIEGADPRATTIGQIEAFLSATPRAN